MRALVAVFVLLIPFAWANADVLELKTGQPVGAADTFVHWREGRVVIVDASGASQMLSQDEVVSMKLEGPRRIEFNNGDILHVENVVVDEGKVSFTSELLGRNAVPLAAVTAISPPAGAKVLEAVPLTEEKPAAPPKKWSGNVQFAYASTSGREDTQNASLAAEAIRETEKTRLTLKAAGMYGQTNREKTADAQEASGKFDYFVTDRVYLYGGVGALRDTINLIDWRLSPGVGVGRKFITGDRFSLEGETGVTMIWEQQKLLSGEKETESELYGRVAGRLRWKFAPGAEFSEEVEVLPGLSSGDELRYRSVSQLTATLIGKLSLAAGFTVDYDNNPPPDVPCTSTHASTGFIYNF